MFRISRLKAWLAISSMLFPLISFPSSVQGSVSTEEIVDRLRSTYKDVSDMTADFTQRSSIEGFDEKVFSGRLYLKKPGMVRWDYLKPEKQNIFIKGEKAILYLPRQRQAIVQNLSENPEAEPALGLLSDIERWRELFHIKVEEGKTDPIRLELRPKKMPHIERVLVDLQKETFYIQGLTLFEKGGNRVSFVFSNIRPNRDLKEGFFDFKIPGGIEVLEY